MIDGDPVELDAEIGFHLLHQFQGGSLRIGELDTIFGGHNEAELMTIFVTAFDEGSTVLDIPAGRIDLPLLRVLCHTIALEIAEMGIDGSGLGELLPPASAALRIELHDTSLDRAPPRARADATVPAPGITILQGRSHRRTATPRVEPAASLPGTIQPRRIAAGAPDSLLDLPGKADVRPLTPPARLPPIRVPPRSRILPGLSRKSSSSRAMA